jgi:hypothetical protein
MREERVRDALAACVEARGARASDAPAPRAEAPRAEWPRAEWPRGRGFDGASADLTDGERAELASLLFLADQLDERMQPLHPSPAFVRSLKAKLVEGARRQMVKRERRRRVAVIGAAVAGGLVSIASLAGGVVLLIKWLRTRTEARQASAA